MRQKNKVGRLCKGLCPQGTETEDGHQARQSDFLSPREAVDPESAINSESRICNKPLTLDFGKLLEPCHGHAHAPVTSQLRDLQSPSPWVLFLRASWVIEYNLILEGTRTYLELFIPFIDSGHGILDACCPRIKQDLNNVDWLRPFRDLL